MTNLKKCLMAALSLALAATCLAACSGGGSKDKPAGGTPTEADIAGWKTMGDALACATDSFSYGLSDTTFIACFQAGDAYIRAIGTMTADIAGKLSDLDPLADDRDTQRIALCREVPLASAEDITDQALSEKDLKALEGKTGRELLASGFSFDNYTMTGGDQTGVSLAKGYFEYFVIFAVATPTEQADDEGAAIMDAKVAQIQMSGFSVAAIDPAVA